MEALLLTYALVLGAAGLTPRIASGPGLDGRFFTGYSALIVFLFIGQIGFGLHLRSLAMMLAPAMVVGAVLWFRQGRAWLRDEYLTHPALILPALMAMLVGLRGGEVDYLPLAWDEFSNWLTWAKQYVEYGNVGDPRIQSAIIGYTPGWPLILALHGLWNKSFDEGSALMAFAVLHIALLGLIYDVLLARLWRAGHAVHSARVIAWAAILALLAVEASWKLFPINLLIEEPQTYCLVACVLLAFGWCDESEPAWRVALPLGLAFSLGYVIKGAMLAFAPSLFILFAGFLWSCHASVSKGWARPVALGTWPAWAMLAAPILASVLVWRFFGTHLDDCLSQPVLAFKMGWARLGETERVLDLWSRYWGEVFTYLAVYKMPVTLGAVSCLLVATAITQSARFVSLAIAVFCVVYFMSLYFYHLDCFGEYYFTNLNSIERFARVPLRLLHVAGPVVLLHVLAPRLVWLGVRRVMMAVMAIVALLGAFQVNRMNASLRSVASRSDANPVLAGTVRTVRDLTRSIAKAKLGTEKPVIFLDQGSQDFAPHVARYFGRGALTPYPGTSWGPKPINIWMRQANAQQVKDLFLGASVIVPLTLDDWMRAVLIEMSVDQACLSPPSGFLLPDPATRTLRCVERLP